MDIVNDEKKGAQFLAGKSGPLPQLSSVFLVEMGTVESTQKSFNEAVEDFENTVFAAIIVAATTLPL